MPGPQPSVQIQKRDIDILKALLACRFLSTSQIQRVFFEKNRSVVCSRLNKKLLPQKIVNRHYPKIRFQNTEAIYSLGSEGARILKEKLGVDARVNLGSPSFSSLFLNHLLEINEFWIALRDACQPSYGNCTLVSWWTEHKIRKKIQPTGETTPIPDARFVLKYQDGTKGSFLLEIDRGSEKMQVIQSKVRTYLEYYLSGRHEVDYGFKKFRVLVVVPNRTRLEKALKAAAEAGANNMFLFGLKEDVTPKSILGRVWVTPRDFYDVTPGDDGRIDVVNRRETSGKRYSIGE